MFLEQSIRRQLLASGDPHTGRKNGPVARGVRLESTPWGQNLPANALKSQE